MAQIDDIEHVYLEDSWVLSVETTASWISFVLEAALLESHPRFYTPPNLGERHAYAKLRWSLQGEVQWTDGPHLDHPATDASGTKDFGHIDSWHRSGDLDRLEGDWGAVAIRNASHLVEYYE